MLHLIYMTRYRSLTAFLLVLIVSLTIGCTKIIPAPKETAESSPDSDRPMIAHVSSTADIQAALAEHGIKIAVDGKMGPQTKSGLKAFQQRSGLKVTGIADPATLTKLGL